MTAALLLSIVVSILAIILTCNRAAGRWHDLKDGEIPLKGIPVLTEYVNKVGGYHGFRVDTYSTKRQEWVEATAWDQEVIRYAEIKHDHS